MLFTHTYTHCDTHTHIRNVSNVKAMLFVNKKKRNRLIPRHARIEHVFVASSFRFTPNSIHTGFPQNNNKKFQTQEPDSQTQATFIYK